MSTSGEDARELAQMANETGKSIAEQNYITVLEFLCDIGLSEGEAPVPLEQEWKTAAKCG